MAFVATGTNYAQQYARELANAYPYHLYFNKLRSKENDTRYKVVNGTTIMIPVVTTSGRKNADNDNVQTATRNHNNKWEPKTLSHHRYWKDLIAPADIVGTNEVVAIGNITRTFNEQQKFPEMDAYLISKLYSDYTAAGKTANKTVLTVDNVLVIFDELYTARREARVPKIGEILYVTPTTNKLLKQAVKRYMNSTDTVLSRAITLLDDVEIEEVPSVLMKTAYDFTEGWEPAASAAQINMAFANPSALITPEIYSYVGLSEPSANTDGKHVYYEESWDDVFILNERIDGISFHVTE